MQGRSSPVTRKDRSRRVHHGHVTRAHALAEARAGRGAQAGEDVGQGLSHTGGWGSVCVQVEDFISIPVLHWHTQNIAQTVACIYIAILQ